MKRSPSGSRRAAVPLPGPRTQDSGDGGDGVSRRRRRRRRRDFGGRFGGRQRRGPLGIAAAELSALRSNSEPMRFEPIDELYSDSDMAFADERPDSFNLLADEELRGSVAEAVAALPERLQLIVQLYFVEELNLSEIAEVLAVSIPRVHQLKAQALDKLKAALAGVAEIL